MFKILYKPGLEMLKVFHRFRAKGTILDDVTAFEKPVSTSSKKAFSSGMTAWAGPLYGLISV